LVQRKPNFSEEYITSIFRVKGKTKQETSRRRWKAQIDAAFAGFLLSLLFNPEDGGILNVPHTMGTANTIM
jgi:hypothetical protein